MRVRTPLETECPHLFATTTLSHDIWSRDQDTTSIYGYGLLEVYVLQISKVISGWVPPCDSAYTWWLYSAAPLGNQAIGTMTQHLTQSNYPDTKLPILVLFY